MTCGIYAIRNTETGEAYVGSSADIEGRWGKHRLLLGRGVHHSRKLQAAWDTYGSGGFELEVLETLPPRNDILVAREQRWINLLNSFCGGYNARPRAESCLGLKRSPFTKEHRNKLSESKTGEKNPNYGKPRSETTKKRIAQSNKGKSRSEQTKLSISVSRIRPGDPRYTEFAALHRTGAITRAADRGWARFQQDLVKIREVLILIEQRHGRRSPSMWNRCPERLEAGLTAASRSRTYVCGYVTYGMGWEEFLAAVEAA